MLIEDFFDWLNHDASKYSELEKNLSNVESTDFFVKIFAQIILFIKFIGTPRYREDHKVSKKSRPDGRKQMAQKTTDEVMLEVLQNIQSPDPTPPKELEFEEPENETVEVPVAEEAPPEKSSFPKSSFDKKPETDEMPVVEASSEQQMTLPKDSSVEVSSSTLPKESSQQLEVSEVFLNQMQEQTKVREESIAEEMKRLRGEERIIFWGFIIAATITLLIVMIGTVLIFREQLTVGIVSGVVGILPGAGTLILNRQSKKKRESIERLEAFREDNLKMLQAIQATLLIPDFDKRSDAIVSLASRMVDRVINPG